MSLIAEFTIETPVLRRALDAVPGMVLHTEAWYMAADPPKSLVWAWGDDFRTFERAVDHDPTIQGYEVLTDVADRRLYRVTYAEAAEERHTYPVLVEHDSVVLDTTGTHEGLEIRARFPSRDALAAYRAACRERDVPFSLRSLYPEDRVAGPGGVGNPYGLTDAQTEVLRCALRMGYFAVPRETRLSAVADELGISSQAASTRLRRAQQNLLRAVVER